MAEKAKIRSLPKFAHLPQGDFDQVYAAAAGRSFAAGATVSEQGDVATYFFVLLDGRLRVTQVTAESQQVIVRIVNPGDLFGIAKALQRTDYPGTATAVSDSVVLSWPMARWSDFMGNYPSMAMSAMQTMGTRLQEAQARMRELATEEVERRVAHAVLRLGEQSGREEAGGIRIDFPVSKQDIAEMTGTTLHTVSRILTAWEHAGLVVGGQQKLLLKDRRRLALIGDGEVPGLLGG
ncbi:Crp/Fnr family transcriptional regulator [Devosia submarina]|uniref:Crp/Fnr family transcriptional regulator n=1 Tax=Devosia submarina TaxID=1173082 RepID=UPI000D3A16EE|nr:Crp/Fnr family transcriptional regulator [Devosia submarina]